MRTWIKCVEKMNNKKSSGLQTHARMHTQPSVIGMKGRGEGEACCPNVPTYLLFHWRMTDATQRIEKHPTYAGEGRILKGLQNCDNRKKNEKEQHTHSTIDTLSATYKLWAFFREVIKSIQ